MTSVSTDRRQGLNSSAAIKVACRVASTGNIVLTGLQTIDGIALATGDRVLLKDQTDPKYNGIWVADTGNWARDLDFDGPYDLAEGTLVMALHGNLNAGYVWKLTTIAPVIGTSNLTFAQALFSDSSALGFTDDGPNAVAIAVRTALIDRKSIRYYGGVPGAGVDNTNAFLLMKAVMAAQGGGSFKIPVGIWMVDPAGDPLKFTTNNVILEGDGHFGTIIRASGAGTALVTFQDVARITMRDLQFDANGYCDSVKHFYASPASGVGSMLFSQIYMTGAKLDTVLLDRVGGAGVGDISQIDWLHCYFRTGGAAVGNVFLAYNTMTAAFTVGEEILGATSGARAIITANANAGVTGTLSLWGVSGAFTAGEVINSDTGGSATTAAVLSGMRSQFKNKAPNGMSNNIIGGFMGGPGASLYNIDNHDEAGLNSGQITCWGVYFQGAAAYDVRVGSGAVKVFGGRSESYAGWHSLDTDTAGLQQEFSCLMNHGVAGGGHNPAVWHEGQRGMMVGGNAYNGAVLVGTPGAAGRPPAVMHTAGPNAFNTANPPVTGASPYNPGYVFTSKSGIKTDASGAVFVLQNTTTIDGQAHIVSFTNKQAVDLSAIYVTVVGTDAGNNAQSEIVYLPTSGVGKKTFSTKKYKTVTDGAGHLIPSASTGADTVDITYEYDFVIGNASNGAFLAGESSNNGAIYGGHLPVGDTATRDLLVRRITPQNLKIMNKSANYNVAAADSGKDIQIDATAVMTLPATVVGMTFKFTNIGVDGFVQISLSPAAADKIIGADLAPQDDKDLINTLSTARRGDYVVIAADGVDGWYVQEMNGIWAREA